jgi:membrane carboxypeptidase/penicillin-binding protein PbpC
MAFVQEELKCPGLPAVVRCGRCGKTLTKLKSQIAGLGAGCSRITKGQHVTGNNTLLLNDQTMIEAVQYYLNNVVLREDNKVRVTFVKAAQPGQTQVTIVTDERKPADAE